MQFSKLFCFYSCFSVLTASTLPFLLNSPFYNQFTIKSWIRSYSMFPSPFYHPQYLYFLLFLSFPFLTLPFLPFLSYLFFLFYVFCSEAVLKALNTLPKKESRAITERLGLGETSCVWRTCVTYVCDVSHFMICSDRTSLW